MTPSFVRRIDLYEAVKYDIRLHGFRFILLEFLMAGLGAIALASVEFLHAGRGSLPVVGGVWFLGVALNCGAVVFLALQTRRTGTSTRFGDRRLHVYALELVVMLLIPLAVALAALQQWRAGDFRAASGLSPAKEIL